MHQLCKGKHEVSFRYSMWQQRLSSNHFERRKPRTNVSFSQRTRSISRSILSSFSPRLLCSFLSHGKIRRAQMNHILRLIVHCRRHVARGMTARFCVDASACAIVHVRARMMCPRARMCGRFNGGGRWRGNCVLAALAPMWR